VERGLPIEGFSSVQPGFSDLDVQYLLGDFPQRLFPKPHAVVLEKYRREYLDSKKLKAAIDGAKYPAKISRGVALTGVQRL
jgi:hypothetical protein